MHAACLGLLPVCAQEGPDIRARGSCSPYPLSSAGGSLCGPGGGSYEHEFVPKHIGIRKMLLRPLGPRREGVQ